MPSNPKVYMDVRIGNENAGRMEFELFADTTPRTAENFRCFCTGEKGKSAKSGKPLHFRNTVFHRIIKGFMAQGGDFDRADGTGGESIYGKTFKDENFARKHIGPGMLSMANCGKNTNGSQFFITFKTTSHLNNKHVVFGRLISGMATLKKLEGTPVERGDRPRNETRIVNCGEVGKAPPAALRAAVGAAKAAAAVAPEKNQEELDIEEEKEEVEVKPVDTSGMNPRQKQLFELRQKLNGARKSNRREAAEESKRFNSKKKTNTKRQDYMERKEAWEKDMKDRGEDGSDPWMHETAESVIYREKKNNKKKGASYGWEVFNQDAGYNAYKKRLEEQRKTEDHTDVDINSLDYFEAHEPSSENVDRMVKELDACAERRGKFSRRRPHYEDKDIDYINDRNEVFNKKAKRAYDKYTAEIRTNFERGTAL